MDAETYAVQETVKIVGNFNLEYFVADAIKTAILQAIEDTGRGEFINEGKFIDKKLGSIELIICAYFRITLGQLNMKSRKRTIVTPRQLAHFYYKEYEKGMSLAEIGDLIGNKDHSTVLHSCKTVNNLTDTNKKYAQDKNVLDYKIKELYERKKLEKNGN